MEWIIKRRGWMVCVTDVILRKPNLSLLQLIQIVINTVHLEETNIYLEEFITEVWKWPRIWGNQRRVLQLAFLRIIILGKINYISETKYLKKIKTIKWILPTQSWSWINPSSILLSQYPGFFRFSEATDQILINSRTIHDKN